MRWFRGSETARTKAPVASSQPPRRTRRSTGFSEFTRSLKSYEPLSVLDLGPTSSANIEFFTELGGRFRIEDILRASLDKSYLLRQQDGSEAIDAQKFFSENLNLAEGSVDAVLCWDIPDFLPDPLVKPMVERIHQIMKPGGILLAFFHTKDAGPDSPYCRYRIVNGDEVELEPRPDFRLQRIFNNRHIENLFKDFGSRKFFLARDNIREVITVR